MKEFFDTFSVGKIYGEEESELLVDDYELDISYMKNENNVSFYFCPL